MIEAFPPGLIMVFGAFLLPVLRGGVRTVWLLGLPLLALYLVWQVPDGVVATVSFLDYRLEPLRGDRLSRLFATIFGLMAFVGGIYAYRQARLLELCAAMIYAGAAIGATMAGDLISLFVCWELMALGSTLVIWSVGKDKAYGAGMRYLLIHLLGGVVLMAGIAAYVNATGSVAFNAIDTSAPGAWLMLVGFLINAGAPPLSAWIADAYPEASPSGTVFLSAFTTKTAVYVLMRGFPGTEILIFIGLAMIFYGIIYALLENDVRRILAYSIVNQVGFMVTGIGIGTELAINGAAAHAFAGVIYTSLLMMSAGAVLYRTGRRKCSELGGLLQGMPFTTACGVIGALAISAFPLSSGFISKLMTKQAAADEHLLLIWLLLQAASAGVFLSVGIKFPWFVFFEKNSGLRPPEAPLNMRVAMGLFASLCIFLGVAPGFLYAFLPFAVDYVPYTGGHVVMQLQLLLFSGLAFFVLLPLMKRTLTISLDLDWFYRRFAPALVRLCFRLSTPIDRALRRGVVERLSRLIQSLHTWCGPQGVVGRAWATGPMVVVVLLLLSGTLAFYFGGT